MNWWIRSKIDPNLNIALDLAIKARENLDDEIEDPLSLNESQFARELQKDFVNFYEPSTVNPYIPLAAKRPMDNHHPWSGCSR